MGYPGMFVSENPERILALRYPREPNKLCGRLARRRSLCTSLHFLGNHWLSPLRRVRSLALWPIVEREDNPPGASEKTSP